jgi:hypothetical protein
MYLLSFTPLFFFVKDRVTRDVPLRGWSHHGLYSLDVPAAPLVLSAVRAPSSHWHSRLGHPATPIVHHVLRRNDLTLVASNKEPAVCDACQQGKSH